MAVPFCAGEVVDVSGVVECHDDMGMQIPWESYPTFTIADVDPAIAGSAFAGGFAVVGTAWAIGWGARALLRMIR